MKPRTVVIVGGNRGLGRGLVKRFVNNGDRVYVLTRSGIDKNMQDQVRPIVCDVSNMADVLQAKRTLEREVDNIDLWFNSAALSDGYRAFNRQSLDKIDTIVGTNLGGSLLCTRIAIELMEAQNGRGHVFNCTGAGSDHFATPLYSVYGATKSGLIQFVRSLREESKSEGRTLGNGLPKIAFHLVSPGLMTTNVLMTENMDVHLAHVMNLLAEDPDTVATHIYADMNRIVNDPMSTHSFIRYFNVLGVVSRMWRSVIHR